MITDFGEVYGLLDFDVALRGRSNAISSPL